MATTSFSTIGGQPTEGEAYTKLIHHLREAQDQALVISHIKRANDSHDINASGWRGVAELIDRLCAQITKMAMKKLQ